MKTREYTRERVELCRNCQGAGVVFTTPDFHPHGREVEATPIECPVCGGSGRVRKVLDIKITIEPYAKEIT
jgi:DnaJ-class molecular chaperone